MGNQFGNIIERTQNVANLLIQQFYFWKFITRKQYSILQRFSYKDFYHSIFIYIDSAHVGTDITENTVQSLVITL